MLAFDGAIEKAYGAGIIEDEPSPGKADSVLETVPSVLSDIPFEAHSAAPHKRTYSIVITRRDASGREGLRMLRQRADS